MPSLGVYDGQNKNPGRGKTKSIKNPQGQWKRLFSMLQFCHFKVLQPTRRKTFCCPMIRSSSVRLLKKKKKNIFYLHKVYTYFIFT